MLEIRNLRKLYREFVAVERLDLTLAPGDLYIVLGPNGAGKTTTLKCAVGLLHPTAGTVRIGGHDLLARPQAAKRLLGYVPDRPFLYDKLTGAEFIRFTGRLYGLDPGALKRRAEEYLERFRLAGWENELIESYSYGMRQKIVLTAVFAREPPVFVIDEPMVGLDPRAAKTLREILLQLVAAGSTVLLSTHSVGLAEQMATRLGIIDHGRLVAEGTMHELRARAGKQEGLEEVFLALTEAEAETSPAREREVAGDPA